MVRALAPEARAASTKSRPRTCVVTLSATRVIGGMNTLVSEVRYDIAYADAQNAYANLYAAMGIDTVDPRGVEAESVAAIAGRLKDGWQRREVAFGGAQ